MPSLSNASPEEKLRLAFSTMHLVSTIVQNVESMFRDEMTLEEAKEFQYNSVKAFNNVLEQMQITLDNMPE